MQMMILLARGELGWLQEGAFLYVLEFILEGFSTKKGLFVSRMGLYQLL
jgi:hypothetical protein